MFGEDGRDDRPCNNPWLNRRRLYHRLPFATVVEGLQNKINQRHINSYVWALLRRRLLMANIRSLPPRHSYHYCKFFSTDSRLSYYCVKTQVQIKTSTQSLITYKAQTSNYTSTHPACKHSTT
jgi:hypothetical protein